MLWLCAAVSVPEVASFFISVDILLLLILGNANTSLGSGLSQHFLVLNHLLQQIIQLFISDQTATQVSQTVTQLQQLAKRCYLLGNFSGLKIVHTFETQLDVQFCIVLVQAIWHFES